MVTAEISIIVACIDGNSIVAFGKRGIEEEFGGEILIIVVLNYTILDFFPT